MKTISIFLSLINSIIAGLLLAFTLSASEIHRVEVLWFLTKLIAGMSVIIIGVLTWLGSAGAIKPGLLPLTSLYLVILGTGTIVWTFQLGLLTGDMEYFIAFLGVSLLAQGLASLLGFAVDSRSMVTS